MVENTNSGLNYFSRIPLIIPDITVGGKHQQWLKNTYIVLSLRLHQLQLTRIHNILVLPLLVFFTNKLTED